MGSDARRQKIIRAVIAANPDIDPHRLARIVELTLRLAYSRKV